MVKNMNINNINIIGIATGGVRTHAEIPPKDLKSFPLDQLGHGGVFVLTADTFNFAYNQTYLMKNVNLNVDL